MKIDKEKIKKLLSRNIQEIVDYQHLEKRLLSGKKLRIKYGVDITSSMLHLGHGVNLWKMREFQELGHKVVFLIGDFTTRIGDPTGKSIARPQISKKQIEKDAAEYKKQVSKILLTNSSVFEERRNSEWYDKMKLNEFFQLLSKITHAQLIQRDMFRERIKQEQEIYTHELIYPILQGYDSVMLRSDLTIIGQDQIFNELIGRDYQKIFNQLPQSIITTIITPGIDGKEKQSKSLGNYIAILDTPKDKYGKIMSIPDNLIISYFKVYTKLSLSEIKKFEEQIKKGVNPRDLKARLSFEIVKLYHGENQAKSAEKEFNRVFRDKKLPGDIPVYKINKERFKLMDVLVEAKLTVSKGEARRLIEQGGVKINDKVFKDWQYEFKPKPGMVIKVGKRRFIKLIK